MKKELEKIISECKICAKERGKAMMEGDSVTCNINYDKLVKLLHQIRQFGNEGDIALLSLMEDEDPSVRAWAATHSLQYDERKAKKVLKKIKRDNCL